MVRTCCVIGCNVRSHDRSCKKIENGLSFHTFPAWKQREGAKVSELTKRRRMAWISAVRRPDITFFNVSRYLRVCSRHFHSGKPSYEMDELNPDWVPTLNMGHCEANSRLKLQGGVRREPQDGGGTMESVAGANQPKMGLASHTHNIKKEAMLLFQKTRTDTSLVLLTRKFAQRLNHYRGGLVDLNLVSSELKVSKRRLYDITNVLEGINLMKKTYKNHHQWLGGPVEDNLGRSLESLIEEEEKLDEVIQMCARQISSLCEENLNDRYAYLTYEDIRSIPSFEQQTVIVIRAPPETRLQVPHPEESLQIHLRSTNRPIDVFLCSDTPVAMEPMETTGAGNTSGGQDHLPACGKVSSAPPSFSTQTSTEEDANSSCEMKGFSNPESEVTPHSTLLSFIPLTNSCSIPLKHEHSYAISSPVSSLDGERCLISQTTDEGDTNLSSA